MSHWVKRTELFGSRGAGAHWLSTSDTNHSGLEWIGTPEVCLSVSFSEEMFNKLREVRPNNAKHSPFAADFSEP